MAKVYTGKVMIPGDKLDEYFQILKETEEKREPFRKYLIDCGTFLDRLRDVP
jgi:hypothetical protein